MMKKKQHKILHTITTLSIYTMSTMLSIMVLTLVSSIAGASPFNESKTTEIESIQVIGKKHKLTSHSAATSEMVQLDEIERLSSSVTDIIKNLPGVDITGQGGLFQVFSIHGLSGARVQTQISGIPLHTERRAGTSASFISPFLIDSIEVIKGASSTLYGSGAIGGIAQITPLHFEALTLSTSFKHANNNFQQDIGWGNDHISIGVNHQQQNNGKTSQGNAINSQYQQTSASFLTHWTFNDDIKANFLIMPSYGKDIGKANNEDFLTKKFTIYPKELHILSQFSLIAPKWQSNIAVHQQSLDTYVERFNKRINTVNSHATDFSGNFSQQWEIDNYSGQWGVDQQYRNNVKAIESEQNLITNQSITGTNLLANQYDGALFSQGNIDLNKIQLSAGIRLNYVKQKNNQTTLHNTFSDRAWTGYSNISWRPSTDIYLIGSINKGFRFASLSERFYSGTTARGKTIGNINLAPETATNYQANIHYKNIQFSAFTNKINNYIERINIDENTRTYRNVYQATLKGASFNWHQQVTDSLNYRIMGDYIEGKNENGENLSGISANKIQLVADYQENHWHAQVILKHRFSKHSIAKGEQPLESANIISARATIDLPKQWQVSFTLDNLLNEAYTLTTDSKSSLSLERQFGITLSWQG